ncbi:MAG: hypothetical protein HY652_10050 [Acidobacteria bacterium]|nr:hypothetical protein [Acidobacteriota bacterium]
MGRRTEYVDSLDRGIFIPEPPRRVVSLVPSITELLFAYGLDREIVGVTHFCVHPKEKVSTRVRVGGTKRLRCHAVIRLQPDLVVACAEENEREQVLTLMEAGLNVYAPQFLGPPIEHEMPTPYVLVLWYERWGSGVSSEDDRFDQGHPLGILRIIDCKGVAVPHADVVYDEA